ncbi:hypothetical protein OIO90_001543 [Microbotryomycetes sp. JL221]|nr:hypothetical protein OIO90_001543 [Microbotryomycetes sp. JL221]
MPPSPPLYAVPIPERPKHGNVLVGIVWATFFNLCIILTHVTQLLLITFPRRILQRVTKSIFGTMLVAMTQVFGPTTLIISSGHGCDNLEFERDGRGNVTGIKLNRHSVWASMSNHQTLADWVYIWTFAYLTHLHQSIFIILKASIGKVPIIGWGAKLFGFIFLDRNWTSDRIVFAKQLKRIAEGSREHSQDEMTLLIFPEGTIVTKNTRPKSLAFAEKMGLPDYEYTLLPRSTGLFFSLRNLVKQYPDLTLVDLTIGYPGACNAPKSYPEDHFSLTIWFKQVPPPKLHIHIKRYKVITEVPLGDLSHVEDNDGEPNERQAFDNWLRQRWQEKDDLMKRFATRESFVDKVDDVKNDDDEKSKLLKRSSTVEWNVRLRHQWEFVEVFSWFIPVAVGVTLWWLYNRFTRSSITQLNVRPVMASATTKACCAAKAAAQAARSSSAALSKAAVTTKSEL